MADITQLILDDHAVFRRQFAALDDADPAELGVLWDPLADLLEGHTAAEEAIFYPQLLRRGDDAEDETVGAIGDHNDIRGGVREAARYPVGTSKWWDGVWQTAGPTAITWPRRKMTPSPAFGEILLSVPARIWGVNSTSSRTTMPTPRASTPTTRTRRVRQRSAGGDSSGPSRVAGYRQFEGR